MFTEKSVPTDLYSAVDDKLRAQHIDPQNDFFVNENPHILKVWFWRFGQSENIFLVVINNSPEYTL